MFNLKACPFCGDKIQLISFHGQMEKVVELHLRCNCCSVHIILNSEDFEEPWNTRNAIEIWNNRKGAEK